MRCGLLLFSLLTLAVTAGCVRRTISISSDPAGALVWLNDREIGRTPVDVDFLYYGTYDVRLDKDGYEIMMTSGKANPPWWDSIPLDFFAEVVPGEHRSRVAWHYVLEPRNDDPAALRQRAGEMRSKAVADSPAPQQNPPPPPPPE